MVVLDRRGRLVLAESWRPSTRSKVDGYRIESDAGRWLRDPCELGVALVDRAMRAGVLSVRLVVEDTFVGRNPRTTIRLARWSGLLVGAIVASRRGWAQDVEWVEPDRWRSVAFSIPFATRRAEAKQRVREAVRDRYSSISSLASPTLSEHVADSIGIALYRVATVDQQGD